MTKTAKGLVEYVIAQLGRPYWYGTFGQAASKALYNEKKEQYPKKYGWNYNGTTAKVHDCVGLVKGYLWCDGPEDATPVYDAAQDISANMMYAVCEAGGQIHTMPDVPGVLVFYNNHMGVYIGNGEVVEARGRKYGVVKTLLTDRPWTSWGYCPYVTYETEQKMLDMKLPVLKKGAKGQPVKAMQILLIGYGFPMEGYGPDGSFGGATKRALEKFQEANGLEVDGSCGRKTWAKLLGL